MSIGADTDVPVNRSANDPPCSTTRVHRLSSTQVDERRFLKASGIHLEQLIDRVGVEKKGKGRVSFLAPFAVVIHASNIGNTFILWRISGRRMNKTVHYALVAFWEKSGCKIVADYPAKQDPAYREIALSTVDGLTSVENDKISFDRGK